jgi:hypothetical protein
MIVFRKLLIVGFVLAILLTPMVVLGDPSWGNKLEVQGAHVVSEGAYFRFLLVNHYSYPIYVSIINDSEPISIVPPDNYLNVNITDSIYILPNSSANWDVIAPNVSFPYRVVTYTIVQALDTPISEHWVYIMKFQVTALASGFVQILNTILNPIFYVILIAVGLILVTIPLIIWKRLHGNIKRSQNQTQNMFEPKP